MNKCETIREMLVLYAEEALDSNQKRLVDEHLAGCAACGREAAQIGALRSWLTDPELFEPEQDMAWQCFPEKLAARAQALPEKRRSWAGLSLPQWACVTLGVLPIVIGLIWVLRFQVPAPTGVPPALVAAGNEAFLQRIHNAYAREATSQYLSGCHALLLDLVSAEKTCTGDRYDVALEVTRARQLLQEKRMLDADLHVPDVARAKALCDELETVLVNMSMAQECESDNAIRGMERFIESKQLLLRIDLMQPGISPD
jgi:predicted anti-sigma-YlaC factor YlaD